MLLDKQGSSQEKIKEGVALGSKHICGFSDHIKEILLPSLDKDLNGWTFSQTI